MKFAACWRYESSLSSVITPVLTVGVLRNSSSAKYQRFEAEEGPEDPGTVVDDITPEDAIDCTES